MNATIWRALTALLGLCAWLLVPAEAAADPLHRWLFNEGAGTTAVDSGSSPANGTLGAAASWAQTGDGFGVSLSGVSNSKVDFPSSVGAFGTADFTVAFALTGAQLAGAPYDLVGNRSSSSNGNFFQIRMHGPSASRPNGSIVAEIDQNGTNYIAVDADAFDGATHHVAVTRSGNTLTLAIDGVVVDTGTAAGIANVNGANPFRIGRSVVDTYPPSQFHPSGTFDNLAIFNRALAPWELAELAGACYADHDGDAVISCTDNCSQIPNADQADFDADGVGDACDGVNDVTPAPSPFAGGKDPRVVFGANEALAARFAPKLVFDTGATTFPMSAQSFYETLPTITQNTSYAAIAANEAPTYYQIRECGDQVRIRYWWFYGHQDACAAATSFEPPFDALEEHLGAHNGDWETVMVTLSSDRSKVAAVTYWAHGDHFTRLDAHDGFSSYGSHPIVYVGRITHGSYHNTSSGPPACTFWGDSRSSGPSMTTWNNLVSLDGDEEAWLAADRVGGFSWGPGGFTTHPTQSAPTCDMNATDWTATFQGVQQPLLQTALGGTQCKSGDETMGPAMCLQQCYPAHQTMGLLCVRPALDPDDDCDELEEYLNGSCLADGIEQIPGFDWSGDTELTSETKAWMRTYAPLYPLPTNDLGLLAGDSFHHYMFRHWSVPRWVARRPLAVMSQWAETGGVYSVSASHGIVRRSWTGSAWSVVVATNPETELVPGSLISYSVGPSSRSLLGVSTDGTLWSRVVPMSYDIFGAWMDPEVVPGSMITADGAPYESFGVTPNGQIIRRSPAGLIQELGAGVIPGSLVPDYNHGAALFGVAADGQLVVAWNGGNGTYQFGVPGMYGNLVAGSLTPVSKNGPAGGLYGVSHAGEIIRATWTNSWGLQVLPQPTSPVVPGSLISADGHASALLGVNALGRVVATYRTMTGNIAMAEIPQTSGVVPGSLAYAGPTAGIVGVARDGNLVRIWRDGPWHVEPVAGNTAAVFPLTMTPGSEYGGDGTIYAVDRNGRLIYTSFQGSTLVAATVTDANPEALDPERDCSVCPVGECAPGAQESCYSGPQGSEGVGICAAGTRTCDGSAQWGFCVGDQLPETEVCAEALDNDCDGEIDEAGTVTIGQVDLTGPSGGPVSLEASSPLSFDTIANASFSFADGTADDFAILASDADPPTYSLVGSVVTLDLPSSYILFQDTTGFFGFEGDLGVHDEGGNSFTRTGWAQTHVTNLAGIPSRPFTAPVLSSELDALGWVDAGGVASLRLYLFTDAGFVDVTVQGKQCQ